MFYGKEYFFRKNAAEKILPRQTFLIDPSALNISVGLIAVIMVAGTLTVSALMKMPNIVFCSLGALYICIAAPGGGVRTDIAPFLTLSLVGGFVFTLFPLLRTLPEIYILPITFLTLTTILLFYGARQPWGISVMLIAANVLIALDAPAPNVLTAFYWGGLYACSSLLTTVLLVMIWNFHPDRPIKRKISRVYQLLANDIRDTAQFIKTPSQHKTTWESHLIRNRYVLRTTLEEVRVIISTFLKHKKKDTKKNNEIISLFNAAEELFSLLIALENEIEFSRHKNSSLSLILQHLAFITDKISSFTKISSLTKKNLQTKAVLLQHLQQHIDRTESLFTQTSDAIAGHKICNTLRQSLSLSFDKETSKINLENNPDTFPSFINVVKARLNPHSLNFRNGLRISILCTLALVYTLRHATIDQHWVAFAVLFIMQPYSLSSISKLSERVIGTIAGACIAALIAYFFPSQFILIPVFIIFSFFSVAFRAVSYGTHIFLLTPLVIFLMTVAFPGTPEATMASARVIYTIEGGALALIGSALLWPEKAVRDLKTEVAKVIIAMQDFNFIAFESLISGKRAEGFLKKQRILGIASNNLDIMLSLALHDASPREFPYVESMLKVGTSLRRMSGCLISLQYFPVVPEEKEKLIILRDIIYTRLNQTLHEEQIFSPAATLISFLSTPIKFSSEILTETLEALLQQIESLEKFYQKKTN